MNTDNYNRKSYIPLVTYQSAFSKDSVVLMDLLRAAYTRLDLSVTRFTKVMVTDAEEAAPDLLAKNAYDDEHLWWVICFYNGILNPLTEIVAGKELKIPDLQQLETLFQSSNPASQQGQIVTVA